MTAADRHDADPLDIPFFLVRVDDRAVEQLANKLFAVVHGHLQLPPKKRQAIAELLNALAMPIGVLVAAANGEGDQTLALFERALGDALGAARPLVGGLKADSDRDAPIDLPAFLPRRH